MLRRILKISVITIVTLSVLCALPFALVHLALSDRVSSHILDKVPELVGLDATIKVGHIDYTFVGSWPDVELSLNDVVVVSKVFEPNDTLLTAVRVAASVSAGRYLNDSEVQVNYIDLVRPVIYGHKRDGRYNWEIYASDTTEVDTASTSIPAIFFEKVKVSALDVLYDDDDDQLHAGLLNASLDVPSGHYTPESLIATLSLAIDSIIYENHPTESRYTIAGFGVNAVASDELGEIQIDAKALSPNITIKDSVWNLQDKNVSFTLKASVDTSFTHLRIDTLVAGVDDNHAIVTGDVDILDASTYDLDLDACLISEHIGQLMGFVPKQYKAQLRGLNFDGNVDLDLQIRGLFGRTDIPVVDAKLNIKDFNARFEQFSQPIDNLEAEMTGRFNRKKKSDTYLNVKKLCLVSGDSDLDLEGSFCYKQGREYIDADLDAALNLFTINNIYRVEENSAMSGKLNACIDVNFFLDDVLNKRVDKLFSKSTVNGDGISVVLPEMGVNLLVDSLRYRLNTNTEVKSRRRNTADTSLVNTRLTFKKMKLNYQNNIKLDASRFSVSFLADDIDTAMVPRLRATMSFRGMNLLYNDTVKVFANKARATVNVKKDSVYYFVPNTEITFSLDSTIFSTPEIGAMLKESDMRLSIQPRFRKRRKLEDGTRVEIPMSEQKIVDLPRLIYLFDSVSKSSDQMETYMKLFRNDGDVQASSFRAKSPLIPIRFGSRNLDLKFSDDTIRLNNFSLGAGKSRFVLRGELINLRRWMLRGRELSADFALQSSMIDLNQIVKAAYAYNERVESAEKTNRKTQAAVVENNIADLNEENETSVKDSTDSITSSGLVVLPNKMNIKFSANVDTLKFSKMVLSDFKGRVTLKDQTLRIKNLSTATQVGAARANMLYKCVQPEVAQVAAMVEMDSVQIGDLVTYMPELDTVMPMLRSLDGNVSARASVSADIDSTTSIVMPSVNAGLWLRGDSLVLMDGETFSEIAKMLMFSKKTKNRVDSVSVELMVRNNEIDIYPFMFAMDKYRLAVGGTQGLDMKFNYHIALLKPVILGLDVYGNDFDHIKFKLTSVKFKNANVSIGKGGTLIRGAGLNLREAFEETMYNVVMSE